MLKINKSLEEIFKNPYEQPVHKGFHHSNPLKIWTVNNDVDVEQHFFKVDNKSSKPYSLEDIERREARIQEEIDRKYQEKQDTFIGMDNYQKDELINNREEEITKKVIEFNNRVNAITFLTPEDKKVMKEKFLQELYQENNFKQTNPTVTSRTGQQIPDLIGELKQLISNKEDHQVTPTPPTDRMLPSAYDTLSDSDSDSDSEEPPRTVQIPRASVPKKKRPTTKSQIAKGRQTPSVMDMFKRG